MRLAERLFLACLAGCVLALAARGQEYGKPDRGEPGDKMIQEYLARQAERLESPWLEGVKSQADWEKLRPRYLQEYYYMLGLWPVPAKTPLEAAVTGTIQGEGFLVEKLHYQSRPRLYVTGNLYRPPQVKPGNRLPAVFYVCGHSYQGRDGNKTAYQSHGIWFARHGYVCLIVDSLQLGEIASIHHGTYREGRWWWHSRGYTPAGVECWNGLRGIDYLQSRPDVDPERIAVTGISGGGAATFWIAAADQRVKVAVPVSGMADLRSYVTNRVINGHCDCMFLYNTFQWPWTRIAALIAPRPLLFTNSDADAIFPMDANDRVINRLERVYSLYGASDRVDAFVSLGGHAYRQDIRQAAYRFINLYLKGDARFVEDSETDLIVAEGKQKRYPIPPEKLRVFPEDSDIPKDQLNKTIDEHFVPVAKVDPPGPDQFEAWKARLLAELRRVSFTYFPERIPPAKLLEQLSPSEARLETEPGIEIRLQRVRQAAPDPPGKRIVLAVSGPDAKVPDLPATAGLGPADEVYCCLARGIGPTRWTRKNPPNYVERSHALLGRTVDTGRVWDVIAAARYLREKHGGNLPVWVAGQGGAGLVAACAALGEPEIGGVILDRPPEGFMDPSAPQLLNVLRVCDVAELLGMLAPRPLATSGISKQLHAKVDAIYAAAGARDKLGIQPK
ncbi:MAG: alpha/beta hydrolase family protein [Thermoguttaceae bacterium]